MKTIILLTGINGGESTIAFPTESFEQLDKGKDNNVRVIYNGKTSYPIKKVIQAPEEFMSVYKILQNQ